MVVSTTVSLPTTAALFTVKADALIGLDLIGDVVGEQLMEQGLELAVLTPVSRQLL